METKKFSFMTVGAARTVLTYFAKKDRYENSALLIASAVFGYTCLRAALLSISHDEAVTYLFHVRGTLAQIVDNTLPMGANNHLLNTLLIKFLSYLFGNSELVLRVPALIGHALYLIAVVKLLKLILNGTHYIVALSVMVANPLLLDFFSCARGYALGMGFFLMGLYFLFRRTEFPEFRSNALNTSLIIVMLTLSVLSNLTFATVYIPVVALLITGEGIECVRLYRTGDNKRMRRRIMGLLFPVGLSSACLALIYNSEVLAAITTNANWGGVTGVWADSVESLLKNSLYSKAYASAAVMASTKILIFATLVATAAGVVLAVLLRQQGQGTCKLLLLTIALLAGVTAVIHIQVGAMQTYFPVGRAAIYLVPLYLIMMICSWKFLVEIMGKPFSAAVDRLGYCIAFVLLLHGFLCFNVTHFDEWKYDAQSKEAVTEIIEATRSAGRLGNRYSVGLSWRLEPGTVYYLFRNNAYWINYHDSPDAKYDYYYLVDGSGDNNQEIMNKYKLTVARSFEVSGAFIAVPMGK